MDVSDIKYARSGDINIAYQRWGADPDLVILGGEWSFAERGDHALKGVDGAWRLYELTA